MKPITGTTIKDGKVHLKKGYRFIEVSDSEVAIGRIKSTTSKNPAGVATRAWHVTIMGSYECKCSGIRGSCSAVITADPFNNLIKVWGCEPAGRGCRRGCEFIVHFPNT